MCPATMERTCAESSRVCQEDERKLIWHGCVYDYPQAPQAPQAPKPVGITTGLPIV
jgi:hypothetical protein